MENTETLANLAMLIATGVVAAFITAKLKLPLILGYLLGGIILGLLLLDSFHSQTIEHIAQLGAAMMLFTVGVEFSLETLKKILRITLPGVIIQSLAVIFACIFVLPVLGFSSYEALFIGILAATSSTVFVVKMLENKSELHTIAGRIMMGWLVLQDILIVVWFLVLQTFAPNAAIAPDPLTSILKAMIVIGVTYGIGQYLLPPVMKQIAKTGSEELLIVSVVGIIAAFAVFANLFEVSFTIGAFLAGLALSESFMNHQIFSEIKPLRNLFTMIFFVSIGAIFNLTSVISNFGKLIAILILVLAVKIVVIALVTLWFKVHIKNALLVGFGISQIGEFAFLGAQLGLNAGWINRDLYSLIIAATIISMALTPFLYLNAGWFYKLVAKNTKNYFPNLYRRLFLNSVEDRTDQSQLLEDHIIVCGYGRVGSYVANALDVSDIPFVVIELDMELAEAAQKKNLDVIFGDATRPEILHEAGIQTAKAIVIAVPNPADIQQIAEHARQINPQIRIVARANADIVGHASIDHTIEPEFSAAVEIIVTLYRIIHRRDKRAIEAVKEIRFQNLAA